MTPLELRDREFLAHLDTLALELAALLSGADPVLAAHALRKAALIVLPKVRAGRGDVEDEDQ